MNMSMHIKLPATQFASRQSAGVPILPSRVSLVSSRRQLARKVLAVQTEEKPQETESKPEIAKVRFNTLHMSHVHGTAPGRQAALCCLNLETGGWCFWTLGELW
jgi:hypothetical protein